MEDKSPASTERHDQLLESLNFEAIDARKTTIKAAHSKTCRWFLKHEDYLAWKDPAKVSEHYGFLWIRGKPGAGKSTIMKFIYLETRKNDKNNQILTASFFFNARGEALEKTISGMYRSLLLQLFKGFPDLQCVLDDADILPQNQITCPSLNCLKDLLRNAVLKLGQRSFTCFIDALDECDEQQAMDLVSFFEDIAETCTEKGVNLRICFSSRHYPYIDIDRGMRLTVENQEGHAGDLESYIKSKLKIKDPTLVAELQDKMLEKASGVFLWIVLVVDVLNDENRRGRLNLRKRLEQIPNGLSELFKDILRRDNTNAEELQLCLLWILLSKRPLRPDEYYHALWSGLSLEELADAEMPSVDATDAGHCFYKSVISSSKGLAEITRAKQPTVQFIHESVRDFLIKDNGLAEIWPELKSDWEGFGHNKLKRCCDFYLRLVTPKETVDNRPGESVSLNMENKYPFLGYACQFVLYHADCAAGTFCQQEFMKDFLVDHWIDVFNIFEKHKVRRYLSGAYLLYILADRGHSSLIRTRLKADPRIDLTVEEQRYVYPLIAAMAKGHKDSVLALLGLSSPLHRGIDVMEGMTSKVHAGGKKRTPLAWACENGYLGVAKLLLQRGATASGWTLLMYAAKGGSVETARWLIEIGEDIGASYRTHSVISLAVENAHAEVVELLLNQGIEPDTRDTSGVPILCTASMKRHEVVARLILDKGGNPEIRDSRGQRPVHYARSKAVMEILVEYGADITAQDDRGKTCCWNTIQQGGIEQLTFLIHHGVDINTPNHTGATCLFRAVQIGNFQAVKLLCMKRADANIQDKEGDTCLHYVFETRNYVPMFQILLKNGANPNATNLRGETCLHRFAQKIYGFPSSNDEWFQVLGRQELDVNACDKNGNTPLHFSSRVRGHAHIDQWLRYGADVNCRNNQGKTPLDLAIEQGNKTGASFLKQTGAIRGSE